MKQITDICYKNATKILTKLRKKLDIVAGELMKKETLDGEEFQKLIGAKPQLAVVKS